MTYIYNNVSNLSSLFSNQTKRRSRLVKINARMLSWNESQGISKGLFQRSLKEISEKALKSLSSLFGISVIKRAKSNFSELS
jgi:hypothetical protein